MSDFPAGNFSIITEQLAHTPKKNQVRIACASASSPGYAHTPKNRNIGSFDFVFSKPLEHFLFRHFLKVFGCLYH